LQLIATRENNSHAYGAKLKKQAEIVEIPVEEWILIVPLQFECDSILEAIHFVSRRIGFLSINYDAGFEMLFDPPVFSKFRIDPSCQIALVSSADGNPGLVESKARQHVAQLSPFFRKVL